MSRQLMREQREHMARQQSITIVCTCCKAAPAKIRIAATDAEGNVLDSTELCAACAREAADVAGLSLGNTDQLDNITC